MSLSPASANMLVSLGKDVQKNADNIIQVKIKLFISNLIFQQIHSFQYAISHLRVIRLFVT